MKILLTGKPGIGKSTALKNVLERISKAKKNPKGVLVHEIRDVLNNRSGFEIEYWPSKQRQLMASSTEKLSDVFISRFSVSLTALENTMIPFLKELTHLEDDFIFLDEIGRMQNLSPSFLTIIDCILETDKTFLGTIVYDDEIWSRPYKNKEKYFVLEVTSDNREEIPNLLEMMIRIASIYKKLNRDQKKTVHLLFHRLFEKQNFQSIYKLFNHAIHYIVEDRILKEKLGFYRVEGFHDVRKVSLDPQFCTCDFFKRGNVCSHIQSVLILENSTESFKLER